MDNSLHYLLMANHAMLQKQLFAGIKDLGLSIGQPKVLDFLKGHDGAVQKEIARGCHIEPASLSTILTGMEKSGLLNRQASEENRRIVNVYLTDKGKELSVKITEAFIELEERALSGLTAQERIRVLADLTAIHDNLEAGL